jgi:hypothetical protein
LGFAVQQAQALGFGASDLVQALFAFKPKARGLERIMNFEPDIEWFPDAGGITEISRWRKPPARNTERDQPR